MLLGALIQYWKPIALATVLAAAFAYRAVLVHQRNNARAQVISLDETVAALRAENATMAAAVNHQNDAIDALQGKMQLAERGAAQRQAQYADSAAQAMRQERAHANALKHAPVPAGCQAAIDWGNAQGPELGQW
jgi:hypothetical protein